MSHPVMQGEANNIGGSSAPQESMTSDYISETFAEEPVYIGPSDKEFIGPRDATDLARPFLQRGFEAAAQIALSDGFVREPKYAGLFRTKLSELKVDIETAIDRGDLRLGKEYPTLVPSDQADAFYRQLFIDAMPAASQTIDIVAKEKSETETQSKIDALGRSLKESEKQRTQERGSAHGKMIELRRLAVASGLTDEQMVEFDKIAGFRTQVELALDAQEDESSAEKDIAWTDKFKQIISGIALKGFGLLPLRSTQGAADIVE